MIGSGVEVGIEASNRLARLGLVQFEPGLTDAEFDDVERRFGFEFADDHRAFLAARLPVWTSGQDDDPDKTSWGWPNWRDSHSEDLRLQVGWPLACVLADVRGGHWPTGWGRRPSDSEEAEATARRLLAAVPGMAPVYAHRYLPIGRGTSGHPVLSIHTLTDIVVYGLDLADYVDREFREPMVTVGFWREYL